MLYVISIAMEENDISFAIRGCIFKVSVQDYWNQLIKLHLVLN